VLNNIFTKWSTSSGKWPENVGSIAETSSGRRPLLGFVEAVLSLQRNRPTPFGQLAHTAYLSTSAPTNEDESRLSMLTMEGSAARRHVTLKLFVILLLLLE
jgi:hypothetical protein